MKNYYNILEVNENASIEVIEKAYKVLVRRYHPDLQGNNPEAERKIRDINEAYNVLSDSFLKAQYDKELQNEKNKSYNENYDETYFGRMFKEQEKLKYQLEKERYDNERLKRSKPETENEESKLNQTSFGGLIMLLKNLFKHRPTLKSIKSIKKIDVLALVLTIIVVIAIGVILYFIPFTHDWMVKNFLDTPLTGWLFK